MQMRVANYTCENTYNNNFMKNVVTVLIGIGAIVFVYMLIFDNGTSSPTTSNTSSVPPQNVSSVAETESEYGSSLAECLQKADSWFVDAKQSAREVLAEEKTTKNPNSGFINQNASSESEIIASLQGEYVDYKNECNKRF